MDDAPIQTPAAPLAPVVIGELSIDVEKMVVKKGRKIEHLEFLDFQVFACLLLAYQLRPGETVTKQAILEHVYDTEKKPDIGVLRVRICNLRKKLDPAPDGKSYIETEWGVGFFIRPLESTGST